MLISIIVPVYNVEKYIRECLDSLINQTYKNIEIIIVDDGSTDKSGEICDEYEKKNKNIRVIHKKNEGLGFARNTGLENVNGKFVTFVDSDDYVDNNFVEELYQNIITKNVDICKSGFRRVNDSHNILSIRNYDNYVYNEKENRDLFLPRMIGSLPDKKDSIEMCVSGALYKMSYIKKYKIKFPSERVIISEDLFFNIDYVQRINKACTIDYIGYNYRYNPSSLTKKYRQDRFEASKHFYLELKKKLESIGYEEETFLRLSRLFFVYIRMALEQENYKVSNKSYFTNLKNIYKICNDKLVIDIINNYPIKSLGIKQKIFIYFIKHKCVNILYIFSLINVI